LSENREILAILRLFLAKKENMRKFLPIAGGKSIFFTACAGWFTEGAFGTFGELPASDESFNETFTPSTIALRSAQSSVAFTSWPRRVRNAIKWPAETETGFDPIKAENWG
jgi:hypothetical protein